MAKYFSGITVNENKYCISIIDDNLNIIFTDSLLIDRLVDLLKRKSVTVMSVDAPLALYEKNAHLLDKCDSERITFKKRTIENVLSSKKLFTYNCRFQIDKNTLKYYIELNKRINDLGFNIKEQGDTERAIIESYPEASFIALGCQYKHSTPKEDIIRIKLDFLKSKGMRIKDYMRRMKKYSEAEINTLCQAYTAYSYFTGDASCMCVPGKGLLVIPSKNILGRVKFYNKLEKSHKQSSLNPKEGEHNSKNNGLKFGGRLKHDNKAKANNTAIVEYCGAQYLYTNTDGVIRISDLRPIKSYRPFTEIYELKRIKLVQVIINTTDGLRKVKANLIPNFENSNCFKAAGEEDKQKLDDFWGSRGDKRGYLIKFNRVEVVKS